MIVENRGNPWVLYALLKTDISDLSGPAISEAVAEYLVDNPTALSDSLGLVVDDGKLCAVMAD